MTQLVNHSINMHRKIFLTIILLVPILAKAQLKTRWIREIKYNEAGFDSLTFNVNLKEDQLGNYYVLLGGSTVNNQGIHILKINKFGFVDWKKSFLTNHDIAPVNSFGGDFSSNKHIMDIDSLGNVFVIAHGQNNFDTAHIVKIDPSGNLLLHRADNVSGGVATNIWGLRVGFDNSIIAIRRDAGFNYVVIKYDNLLNELWNTPITTFTSGYQDKSVITWDNNQLLYIANGSRLMRLDYFNGGIITNTTTLPFPVGLGVFWMNDGADNFHTWKPGTSSSYGLYHFDSQLNQISQRIDPVQQTIKYRNQDGNVIETYFIGLDSTRFNKIDVSGNVVSSITLPQTMLTSWPGGWAALNGFFDKQNKNFYGFRLNSLDKSIEFARLDSNINFIESIRKPYTLEFGGIQVTHVLSNNHSRTLIAMAKGFSPYEKCFTLYNFCNNCIDNLIGNVFVDANNNCIYDSTEMKIKNLMIDVSAASIVMPTDTIGNYGFELPAGVYNVQPILTGALINTCNVLPAQVNVTDTTIAVQNFPLQIDSSYHDFGVDAVALSPAVPGNFYQFRVNVSNHQLFTDSASVTVTLDSLFTFDSLSIPASTINNRTYSFNNVVLPAQADSSIIFYLTTNTTAQFFDSVSFMAAVTCFNGDNNAANDTSVFNSVILSSYDPNDKRVYPEGNITANDSMLTYTIRFQNTGNYMAQNIVLLDTLDTDLNISSLQMLSSSHNYFLTMIDANVLQISFPNINLPDSNSNEPLSHGYFTYTIKLKNGLPVGTQIENSAAIYFDFNAPVITNSVYNTIVNPLGITENNAHNILVNVYPNPAFANELYIELFVTQSQNVNYKLLDIAGRTLLQRENVVAQIGRNVFTEKLILPVGIYFVAITTDKGSATKKIVFK